MQDKHCLCESLKFLRMQIKKGICVTQWFLPELLCDIDMVHVLDLLNIFSRANKHTALPAAQTDFRWWLLHHSLLLFLLYLHLLLHYGLHLKLSDLHTTKKCFFYVYMRYIGVCLLK